MTMPYTRPPLHQRGATLIEVMVSALIVAFGVLAMIALQANSIKFSKTSEYRSVATLLANDLADRMRLNTAAAIATPSAYNRTDAYSASQTVPERDACPTQVIADPGGVANTVEVCTAADLANRDLTEWRRSLFFALPGGDGRVVANQANRTVDIWIAWTDPGQTASASTDGTRSNNGTTAECPAAFVPTSAAETNPPRCMFFRIGL